MYNVKKCKYPKVNDEFLDGWIIENDDINKYPFWANKYLHQVAQGSSQTAKQYAYKLCYFLNYLEGICHIPYLEADTGHLHNFTRYLQYGNNIIPFELLEGNKSGFTVRNYLAVIKNFYVFLYQNEKSLNFDFDNIRKNNSRSYLYGQNWEKIVVRMDIADVFDRSKSTVQYEKWYTDEQVDAILSNFNTYRDKAIFSMSLDGLRIDEILSSKMSNYNNLKGVLILYRSKGRRTGETHRVCVLSPRTTKLLEEYFFNEREIVEEDLIEQGKLMTDYIFVNLKKHSNAYGTVTKYHNALEIIKNAAKNAGFDPTKIRTHSGRSTRAAELFKYQSEHPSELSDNQIKEMMGWKHIESSEPYKNRQDAETTLNVAKKLQQIKEERNDKK